jgi:membrane protein required for beta-lactamase induction
MLETQTDLQETVNSLNRRALLNAFFWGAGVCSVRAIGYANAALKTIRTSSEPLSGATRAHVARVLGWIGVDIWLPVFVVGVIASIIHR